VSSYFLAIATCMIVSFGQLVQTVAMVLSLARVARLERVTSVTLARFALSKRLESATGTACFGAAVFKILSELGAVRESLLAAVVCARVAAANETKKSTASRPKTIATRTQTCFLS